MRIGANFGAELIAAGLGHLPIAWGDDGEVCGRENLTPEEDAIFDGILSAHDPEKPAQDLPYLNNSGLARFTGTSPVAMRENIRVAGVTRISKGRYRITHESPYPSDQYSATPSVFDVNPRVIRVTARTASHIEVRVVDLAGVAQDPAEITVKTERVVHQ